MPPQNNQADADLRFNAVLQDNVSPQVDKIAAKMQQLGASKHEIKLFIKAYDNATQTTQQVKAQLAQLPKEHRINIVVDHAKAMASMQRLREDIGRKPIEAVVRIKDNFDEEGRKMKAKFRALRQDLVTEFSNVPIVPIGFKAVAQVANMSAGAVGLPGLATVGGVGAAAAASFQQNQQMEQDMMSLRTTLKDLSAARAEYQNVQRFAIKTPFNMQDVLQSDIQMRSYGIRPEGPVGLKTAGNLAAGTGQPLDRAMQGIIDAVSRGDFRVMKGLGINVDAQSFAPGGYLQGQSIQQGIGKLINQRFGGATEMQAQTFQGRFSNIQDVVTQNILKPAGTTAFGIASQNMGQLNSRLTGDSPQAMDFQRNLGKGLDMLNAKVAQLWNEIRKGRAFFETYMEAPLKEIATAMESLGKSMAKAFGTTVVAGVKYLAEAFTAITEPMAKIAAAVPGLGQAFGYMKAFQLLGMNKMANPFENFFRSINPMTFSLRGLLGSMKDMVFLAPKMMVLFTVKNILDMKAGTDALTNSMKNYGKEGSNALDRVQVKLDLMSGSLNKTAGQMKMLAAESIHLIPAGEVSGKTAMQFGVTSAQQIAQSKQAGFDESTFKQLYGDTAKRENAWRMGSSGADKAAGDVRQAIEAVAKSLDLKLKPAAEKLSEAFNIYAQNLAGRSVKGATFGTNLRGATLATQLQDSFERVGIDPSFIRGNALGKANSPQEATKLLLDQSWQPSQTVLKALMSHPAGDKFRAEDYWKFNWQDPSKSQSQALFGDTTNARSQQRQIDALGPRYSAMLGQGVKLPVAENQFLKYGAGVSPSAVKSGPTGAIEEWSRLRDLMETVTTASENANTAIQQTTVKQKYLDQATADLNNTMAHYAFTTLTKYSRQMQDLSNQMSVYQHNNILPVQRAQEDYTFKIRGTSRALEDIGYTMGKAQYNMQKYTEGMWKGEQALNDQIHALDMYSKRLEYLKLQNQGMMADITKTNFTEGFKSVVKPLMGFSLERQTQLIGMRKQQKELEKELKFGDLDYELQKAQRTGYQATEFDPQQRLKGVKEAAAIITDGQKKTRALTDEQHTQTLQLRRYSDELFIANRGLRHFQDQQFNLEQKTYKATVKMRDFEDAQEKARVESYKLTTALWSQQQALDQLEPLRDIIGTESKSLMDFIMGNKTDQDMTQVQNFLKSMNENGTLSRKLFNQMMSETGTTVDSQARGAVVSPFKKAFDEVKRDFLGIFTGATWVKMYDMIKHGITSLGIPGIVGTAVAGAATVYGGAVVANTARIGVRRGVVRAVMSPLHLLPEEGALGDIRAAGMWGKGKILGMDPMIQPAKGVWENESLFSRMQFAHPGRFLRGLATQGLVGGLVGGATGSAPLGVLAGGLSGFAMEQGRPGSLIPGAMRGTATIARAIGHPIDTLLGGKSGSAKDVLEYMNKIDKIDPERLDRAAKAHGKLSEGVSALGAAIEKHPSLKGFADTVENIARSAKAPIMGKLKFVTEFETAAGSAGAVTGLGRILGVGGKIGGIFEALAQTKVFRVLGKLSMPIAIASDAGAAVFGHGKNQSAGAGGLAGTAIGGAIGLAGGPFAPISVPLGMAIGGAIGYIGGYFWPEIKKFFSQMPGKISNLIKDIDWGKIGDSLKDALVWSLRMGLRAALVLIFSPILIAYAVSKAIPLGIHLVGGILHGAKEKAKDLIKWAEKIPDKIFHAVTGKGSGKSMWTVGFELMSKIWHGFKDELGAFMDFITKLPGSIGDFLKKAAPDVASGAMAVGKAIAHGLASGIKALSHEVSQAFKDVLPGPLRKALGHAGVIGKALNAVPGAGPALGALAHIVGARAGGIDNVSKDDYPALLHQGEMVLQAGEAAIWRKRIRGNDDKIASAVKSGQDTDVSKLTKDSLTDYKKYTDDLLNRDDMYRRQNKDDTDRHIERMKQTRDDSLREDTDTHTKHGDKITKIVASKMDDSWKAYGKGWSNITHTTSDYVKKVEKVIGKMDDSLSITTKGDKAKSHASGGVVDGKNIGKGHLVRVGEEGYPEAIIPLAPHRRDRAKMLMSQVHGHLAMPYAAGGITSPPKKFDNETAWEGVRTKPGVEGYRFDDLYKRIWNAETRIMGTRYNHSMPRHNMKMTVEGYAQYEPTTNVVSYTSDMVKALRDEYNSNHDYALESMVHEFAHANQNAAAYKDRRLTEGGATLFAKARTQKIMNSLGIPYKHGFDAYPSEQEYVRKHKPSRWWLHDQFKGYKAGGLTGPDGSGAGFTPVANFAKDKFGLWTKVGRIHHNALTTAGRPSEHHTGHAVDISNKVGDGNSKSSETPQEWAFSRFWIKNLGPTISQLIFDNIIQAGNAKGATVTGHMNHVHLGLKDPYAMDAELMARLISRASKGMDISALMASTGGIAGAAVHLPNVPMNLKNKFGPVGGMLYKILNAHRKAGQAHLNETADMSASGQTDFSGFHGGGDANKNRALGKKMAAAMGWTGKEWEALDQLWIHESGWVSQMNKQGSGAGGIPQAMPMSKMASEGRDYMTNMATQIAWGLKYIKSTYGDPVKAWAFWQHPTRSVPGASKNWYAGGGMVPAHLATGMENVPHDNFPAVLHRGETVLRRDEAEVRRVNKGHHGQLDLSELRRDTTYMRGLKALLKSDAKDPALSADERRAFSKRIEQISKDLKELVDVQKKASRDAVYAAIRGAGDKKNSPMLKALRKESGGDIGASAQISEELSSENARFNVTAQQEDRTRGRSHMAKIHKQIQKLRRHGVTKKEHEKISALNEDYGVYRSLTTMDGDELTATVDRDEHMRDRYTSEIKHIKKHGVTKKEKAEYKKLIDKRDNMAHLVGKKGAGRGHRGILGEAAARDRGLYMNDANKRGVSARIQAEVVRGKGGDFGLLQSDHDLTDWYGQVDSLINKATTVGKHHKDSKKKHHGHRHGHGHAAASEVPEHLMDTSHGGNTGRDAHGGGQQHTAQSVRTRDKDLGGGKFVRDLGKLTRGVSSSITSRLRMNHNQASGQRNGIAGSLKRANKFAASIEKHFADANKAAKSIEHHMVAANKASSRIEGHMRDAAHASNRIEGHMRDAAHASNRIEGHMRDSAKASNRIEGHMRDAAHASNRIEGHMRDANTQSKRLEFHMAKANGYSSKIENHMQDANRASGRIEMHLVAANNQSKRIEMHLAAANNQSKRLEFHMAKANGYSEKIEGHMRESKMYSAALLLNMAKSANSSDAIRLDMKASARYSGEMARDMKRAANALDDVSGGWKRVDRDHLRDLVFIATASYNTLNRMLFGGTKHGTFAGGLREVPYDNYQATLHRGESVLQAGEAQVYRQDKPYGGSRNTTVKMESLLAKMVSQLDDLKAKPAGDVQVVNNSQGASLKTQVMRMPQRTR